MAYDSYEFWLTDDKGNRISDENGTSLITRVTWLEATRTANDYGAIGIGLPVDFDTALLRRDRMIQVWRAPRGGALSLFRPYFIRRWRYEFQGDEEKLSVFGTDPNELMRRRIVANYAKVAQTQKSDYTDDMMKEIVTEQFLSDVWGPDAGSRDLSSTYFSVQGDLAAGPILTKGFSWRRVMNVLQDLQKASKEAGTEVFWDVAVSNVTSSTISFQFRTRTGQPGLDLSDYGVLFSLEKGNLSEPFYDFDATDEENYIFGGGQGAGADRETQEAYDAIRYNASQWNRCEGFADARNQSTANGVRESARTVLEVGRPRERFGSHLLDVEGMRFGLDWNWGDKVRVRYRDKEFDAIIRTVQLSLNQSGYETITARLDYTG